ncbi:hypothetical protein Tco_0589072 [Tanacetum coccineum]
MNNVDQEEKEFDLEDIFQIQDVILREKLLNVHRLISNIESLKNNPTPDHVLKSPSFPIPVVDNDEFFEESDTSFSHLDNSLPEFETFSDHTEGTRSDSTTTHANYFLPEIDPTISEDSRVRCCTDDIKNHKKSSKSGKTCHEKRKSTRSQRFKAKAKESQLQSTMGQQKSTH